MPLDPSIPLKLATPENNPLQTAMQAAQFKYMNLNSNQLQQSMNANQAVSQAIQRNTGADGSVNLSGVQSDLAQDPRAAYNLQAATGTNLQQQGSQIQNDTTSLDLKKQRLGMITQQMGTLLNKPDLNRDDLINAATSMGKNFGLPQNVIDQFESGIPTDQSQLKPFLASKIATIQDAGAQLESMTPGGGSVDTGPNVAITNTRLASGAPIGSPVAVYNKGLTPEGASTPTQVGINQQGAPLYGTRGQFVDQANKTGGVQTGLSPYNQASQQTAAQYEQGLNTRVTAAQNSSHYLSEAQDLLDSVRTGGGGVARADLARRAQAIPGMPQSVVDAIAGGNLGNTQVLQKVLLQNAIQQMQANFNGTGAVANVEQFLKNNPNLENDPRAIPKLFDFIGGMNTNLGREQQAYRDFVNKGNNPADFNAAWNASPTMRAFTGQIKPVKTGTYNGRKVVQYSDGSVDYQ
ncbi:hypothetical protein ACPCHQ_17090 [Ralstonia thomasii]|jgi:hypothetical protein|uniref:Uncharacterized protein n=2 Tax=Ralstonia TaxID=48736 RepID=A0ABM9JVQ9_9RALS|nr:MULTISPECIES: hypothetical protein [Ralstonia]MBT2181008.1 hypothetical protein [Ralstonia pickettii]CAJ0710716.1 hypothetical protein LMG7143_01701 [Ralstonia sp. LMG 18095]CAJ0806219.1 hypothetical protein LMG18095_04404 [Ralstonia sp. LMG 18095]